MPGRTQTRAPAVLALAWIASIALALTLLSGVASARAAIGEATLYGTPSAEAFGSDATGSDGEVWTIAGHSGETATIERFAPGGESEAVTVTIPAGDVPVSIAPGPGQTMWLALQGPTAEIGRFPFAGGALGDVEALPAGNEPTQLASDSSGDLYVTEKGTEPQLAVLESGEALKPVEVLAGGEEPLALALASEGRVWVSEDTGGEGSILLIGSGGEEVLRHPLGTGEQAGPIAAAGGLAWFLQEGTEPAIGSITSTDVATIHSAGLEPGETPRGIVAAPDGDIWFGLEHGLSPTVARIDPEGTLARFTAGLAGVRSFGAAIAVGSDRRIWIPVDTEAGWLMAAVSVLQAEAPAGPAPTPTGPLASGSLAVGPAAAVFAAAHATCSGAVFSEGTPVTQWLLDGAPIAGATAATYTPPRAEDGRALSCTQTATGSDGLGTTVTSPARIVHEQPAQPAWPIGPASQHCSSPVCMQDGTGMGAAVQSYREGGAWWLARQVRCVSAPWTSSAGDSAQPAIRALAEARSITLSIQRMTPAGPVTVAEQTLEGLGGARDELDGTVAGAPFAGDLAIPLGSHRFIAGEAWSASFPGAVGRPDWFAPGGGLALYDVSSSAGAARSIQLLYTLTSADRGAHLRCTGPAADGPAATPTIAGYTSREAPVSASASCIPRRLAVGGPQPTVLLDGNTSCLSALAGPTAPATGLQALAVRSGRLAVAIVCGVHGGCGGRLELLGPHATLARSGPLHVRAGADRVVGLVLGSAQARAVARAGHAGLPVRVGLGAAGTLARVRLIALR